jgi:DNA modification methylase
MLKDLPDESVDLCYIDPPFNSNRNYEVFWGDVQEKRAFNDRFGDAQEYIKYMRPRVNEIYRVLKKTGSFYYHCDWHASHYVKIMLDEIFGFNLFQNEIVWQRTNAHSDARKRYPNVSDSIFFYTKSNENVFKKSYSSYEEEYLEKFYKNKDEKGIYSLGDLTNTRPGGYNYEYKGYKPNENGWRCPIETMEKWDNEGLIYFPKTKEQRLRFKRYLDENKGVVVGNIWTDIKPVQSQAKERLGYPTQKPIALMERIINASSNKGDVVLDAFCGCGTTLVAAQKLNRKWIGVDISPTACRVMGQRLYELYKLREGTDFWVDDLPKTEEDLRILPHFEFQNWAVIALGQLTNMSGIPNKIKSGDFGIDGKLYPVELEKKKKEEKDLFGDTDKYYPVQVKQMDKVGRPDIDTFQTAIRRDGRIKGYFVSFDFTKDAMTEIRRLDKDGEIEIVPITVSSLLRAEQYKH